MGTGRDVAGPVNLGNPGEFSMLELAEMIVDRVGSRSQIVFRPLPVDDPRQRKPDIAEAEVKLGWRPKTPLKAGLVKTIRCFDASLPGLDDHSCVYPPAAMVR